MQDFNINYFFRNVHNFPWRTANIDYPSAGTVHSYLCTILANYEKENYTFFTGHPTFRELTRYAEKNGGLAGSIVGYCGVLYSRRKSERSSVAKEVLDFLDGYTPFKEDLIIKIRKKLNSGDFYMPEEAKRSRW